MDKQTAAEMALAERKAQLLRQGEYYRVAIVHAKAGVKHDARPEVMLHTVLDHAGAALRARADSLLRPTGANLAMLMPFAMGALRLLARRRLVKPLLGVAAGVGAVAFYLQRRRAQNLS